MRKRLARSTIALSALLALGTALCAHAQTTTNIQFLKEDLNGDFIPDHNDNTFYTVSGRITSPDFVYFDNSTDTEFTEIYIQDPSDNYGIQILFNDDAFDPSTFTVGREATLTFGNVRQTNGVTNLRPFGDLGSARFTISDNTVVPVTPVSLTVSNLLLDAERWEGVLVTVTNVTHSGSWPAFGASASLTINDGTGSLGFRVDQDTSVAGQYAPTGPFDLTGIFTQFTSSQPPNDGYQIIPRFYRDIDQALAQVPPQIQFIPPSPLSVAANEALSFDILGLDTNANDTLTIGSVNPPGGSTLVDVRDRLARFTYTPATPGSTNFIDITVHDGSVTVTQTMEVIVLTEELANIKLNEVLYDPPNGLPGDANGDGTRSSSQDEFVEIVNDNPTDIDISGWIVRHNQTTDLFAFPSGTILTGKSAAVVFGGGTPSKLFGNAHVFTATAWPNLDESPGGGDVISLHTGTNGVQVFAVAYGALPAYDAFFTDESLTRDPDFTGDFVQHQAANPDRRFSPGTLTSGAAFSGSGLTNVPPELDVIPDASALIGVEVVVPIRALDGDGNTIGLAVSGEPASAVLQNNGDGTGSLVYTGQLADAGMSFAVTVTASDAVTNDTATFQLTVVSEQYSGLVINEVLPDPDASMGTIHVDSNNDGANNTTQDEFIEIINNTTGTLDLAGCMLSDDSSVRHTFPSLTLPVGGVVVVFGGGSLPNFSAAPAQTASSGGLSLRNGADTISLLDPDTNLVDRLVYGSQLSANSWTRSPDINGPFTNHLDATAQARRASPGLKVDNQPFLLNQPPYIQPIIDQTVRVGETLVLPVGTAEPDGDAINLVTNNAPANSSFLVTGNRTGEFTFTPVLTQIGTSTVTFVATDIDGNDSRTVNLVVEESLGNNWNFESGLQGWTTNSLLSTEDWELTSGAGAEGSSFFWAINGFGGTVGPSDDWIISPAIDLSTSTVPVLSFFKQYRFGGPVSNLTVQISTNYPGTGSPLAGGVTWEASAVASMGTPGALTAWEQDSLPLLAYAGASNVYVAFRYVSANGNVGSGRLWHVDQVRIEEAANSPPTITPPLTDQFVFVGDTLSFTVTTEELDGDMVNMTVTNLPAANATFMDNMDGTADFSFTPDGTQVGSFTVTFAATDKDGSDTNVIEIEVQEPVVDRESLWDFENGVLPWTTFSRASNADWVRLNSFPAPGTTNYMEISGFGADAISDDWLISPKIDLTAFTDPQLIYLLELRFGNAVPELTLKVSTNYVGSGDPALAAWQDVAFTPPVSFDGFTSTTNNLSAFTGSDCVYLAFNYVNALGTGDAEVWRVDEILLEETPANEPPVITPMLTDQSVIVGNTLTIDITTFEPDGDTITITVDPMLNNAVLTDVTNGIARYEFTPDASQIGTSVVAFTATDVHGADTNTISIVVKPHPSTRPCGLIFSEYIEGGSNNKALELFNGSGSEIDLDAGNYVIVRNNNGTTNSPAVFVLSGTIPSGGTHVIVNASAVAGMLALADQVDTTSSATAATFYNGNDTLELKVGGAAGAVVDSIGQLGFDPGSEWNVNGVGTRDETLVRKSSIGGGDTDSGDTFDPSAEWNTFPLDTFTDLGMHTSDECPETPGVRMDLGIQGGTLELTWPAGGVLQESEDLTNPASWTDVPGAMSPFMPSGTAPHKAFRLRE